MKPTGCQRLAVQAVDQLLRILFRKIQQILAETAPENRNRKGNVSSDSYHSNRAEKVIEAVCGQLALARLPISQPDVFDGKDPLSYSAWKLSFDALVNHRALTATDKLTMLNRFLGGEAKTAIKGYLMMPPQEAYDEAYALLANRYGDPLNIVNSYKERLRAWPRIAGSDPTGLRKFADFLKQCRTAKKSFGGLRVLDDEPENTELMRKAAVMAFSPVGT